MLRIMPRITFELGGSMWCGVGGAPRCVGLFQQGGWDQPSECMNDAGKVDDAGKIDDAGDITGDWGSEFHCECDGSGS